MQPCKRDSVHKQLTYHGIPVPKVKSTTKETSLQAVEDRQLKVSEFKKLQVLCPHQFTLDACANPQGDNALCPKYCSTQDSFLKRDLENEFVWMNPTFKRGHEFIDHYLK